MSTFPPAKGNSNPSKASLAQPDNRNGTPESTGKGGIPASLKVKAAGTVPSPGVEKNVNLF